MNIGVYIKDELNQNDDISTKLISKINEYGFSFDCENPDVVIFVGGDGTLLRAINEYLPNVENIKFVGINEGSLAFSSSYNSNELDRLFRDLFNGSYEINTYSLLQADFLDKRIYALNEIRIENPFHTLIADVDINDEHLETFRGNGLSVSSVFGSSGYNKSLGGAVVDPSLNVMQLTEIAPIFNRVYKSLGSSLIINANSVITFSGDLNEAIIGYDHLTYSNPNLTSLVITLSDKKVSIISREDESFISRLGEGFIK